MDKNQQISLCGCGWLGLPLAAHLASQGYAVYGSKRNVEDLKTLQSLGIHGIALQLPFTSVINENTDLTLFFSADILIINVPPGRMANSAEQFKKNVMQLSALAKQHGTKKIIFISTTSVYAECQGEITEDTPTNPNTESGHAHVWLEEELRQQWQDNLVVLRLSGLIGSDRHPTKHIVKRYEATGEPLENGLTPVNLIHQQDIIAAIQSMIMQWPERKVLHLSAHTHPTRKQYYQTMAQHLNLAIPKFMNNGEDSKWINAEQSCQALGLTLKYRDLMLFKPYA